MNSASASRSIRYSIPPPSRRVDLKQPLRRDEAARVDTASSPGGWICVYKERFCLRAGRKATGLSRPTLDTAPAPDRRPTKLSDWLRKSGSCCEDVHTLRRDAEALRDVNRDHKFRSRIDLHGFERYPGL